jgi:hypothetical protein
MVTIPTSKRLSRLLLLAASGLVLAACTTATPYQPAVTGPRGEIQQRGYSEKAIEQNRYRVSFSGNTLTKRETVEDYLLFRAAELTLAKGYDWFAVSGRNTEADTRTVREPSALSGGRPIYVWNPYWRVYTLAGWSNWDAFDSYESRQITRYEASAEVVMGKGPKPAGDVQAFDARDVMANLGPRIQRPAD